MKNPTTAAIATLLGVAMAFSFQSAEAANSRRGPLRGLVKKGPSSAQLKRMENVAVKHVAQALRVDIDQPISDKPIKIGFRKAMQMGRSIGLLPALRLASSYYVPVYVRQLKDSGEAVGVIVRPRRKKSAEVLGNVALHFDILKAQDGHVAFIPRLNRKMSGEGIADHKKMQQTFGRMIEGLDNHRHPFLFID